MQIANSLKFLLLLSYIFLAVSATFIFGLAFNLIPHIEEYVLWLTIAGFMLLCLSGVYWLIPLQMLSMNVRKPILEEERLLVKCMNILKQKTKDPRNYRLRIIETAELEAFAIGTRTIAISKGLLYILNEEELIAVMAHEMGHLKARDTFAGTGLLIAFYLPSRIQLTVIRFFFSLVGGVLLHTVQYGILAGIMMVGILLVIGWLLHILTWMIALIMLSVFFLILNWIFNFLYRADSRFTEYRRDAFAQRLGYGPALRTTLIKFIESHPPSRISFWNIFLRSTHPVTHNRIRKLERMNGQRK